MRKTGSSSDHDRARQLYEQGHLSSAMTLCQALLHDRMHDSLANWMLSAIHLRTGAPRFAAEYAIAACRQSSELGIADLLGLAQTLIEAGESRHAQVLLLGIDPDNRRLKRGFWGASRLLGLLELPEPALRLLDAIDEPALLNAGVSHLRGDLLSVLGHSNAAHDAFEDAIRQAPGFTHAHLSLSQLRRKQGRHARIDRLRQLLHTQGLVPNQLSMFNYALFNELDGEGDTKEAWNALVAGAAAQQQLLFHDRAEESRIYDAIIQGSLHAADSVTVDSHGSESDAPAPIFIVGMPRTGTTIVERILGNHPDIRTCGELTALAQQHQWVANRVWNGIFDERSAIEQPLLDHVLLGTRYRYAAAWRAQGRPFYTDKTPENYLAIGLILRSLPNARIIHVRREAIDACFSNYKVLFAPGAYDYSYDFDALASHRRNYARLMRHWDSLYPGRIETVEYEALVTDPEPLVRGLLARCGLDYRHEITDLTANRHAVSTESRNQVREPIHRRNIGGWRRYAQQLKPLQAMLADVE